jgi:undecaprenyl-diphosphatase
MHQALVTRKVDDSMNWIKKHDSKLFYMFNSKLRSPLLDRWVLAFTNLGGATFNIILLIILPFLTRMTWLGIVALTISHCIVHVMKLGFKRVRPYLKESTVIFLGKPLRDCSLPSGHTAAAFASATALSCTWLWIAPIVLPIALLVGWSRVYLGFHYPGDVAVGAFIGSMTTLIVFVI